MTRPRPPASVLVGPLLTAGGAGFFAEFQRPGGESRPVRQEVQDPWAPAFLERVFAWVNSPAPGGA